ncbi:MAG: BppU family phage baseplate upper protein, partial [Tetragenococcus koreensis]|nr:BppU family phage baseplate upper protein [Tetragenococcus koreensis]
MTYEDQNKLYKDIALEVTIDAKKGARNQSIESKATFYSHDIQSGIVKINIAKDGHPLSLPNGTEVLINVVKLGLPQQKLVFSGDIIDGTSGIVHWPIPDQLRGYKGSVRAGVFINLPNGQRLHGGYFKFSMGISEIDTNLEEFEEDYWQGWNEFQEEAEAEWSDWKAIRDDTWDKHEKDFSDWKQEQENKQTDYENDTDERWNNWRNQQEKSQSDFESNFAFWKSEQEEEQTGFESDFADWKNTQETKQKNFESETGKKITDINQTLKITDSQVQETNNALENLDAYSKQETDNKLENLDVYSKQETDNKLEEKADKTALNKKAEIGEHGFLTPEKGFENFNTGEEDVASQLQYVRIGPICHISGSIRNLGTLEKDSGVAVATLPYRLAIFMRDVKVSQGSSNNTFTTYAKSI